MSKFLEVDYLDDLEDFELYPKVQEMAQYVVQRYDEEIKDFRLKYRGPDEVREQVIKEILKELGYDFIVSVMDTINDFEFNTLLGYVSIIANLKGHRNGLEIVLRLLGFSSIIKEWWEDPNDLGEPLTYEITIIVSDSSVPDLFETLLRVQEFARNYVYAKIANIDIRFEIEDFATKAPILGGFSRPVYRGNIIERAY